MITPQSKQYPYTVVLYYDSYPLMHIGQAEHWANTEIDDKRTWTTYSDITERVGRIFEFKNLDDWVNFKLTWL